MIIFSERTSLRTWSKEPSRGESETGVSSYTESLYWPATVPAASCLPEGEVLSSIQHMLPEQWIPYEIPGRTLSEITVTLYVCNGCREENRCTLRKQFYVHDTAEKSYRKMLVCSRTGTSITEAERLFLSERIDQEIQKRTILPSYSCIRRRSDHGGKKDRVSLHQCRFTSNQTLQYASFLLKLVRLNALRLCSILPKVHLLLQFTWIFEN